MHASLHAWQQTCTDAGETSGKQYGRGYHAIILFWCFFLRPPAISLHGASVEVKGLSQFHLERVWKESTDQYSIQQNLMCKVIPAFAAIQPFTIPRSS
eukprot:2325410-Pleurochrysis_carterae.AAC.3